MSLSMLKNKSNNSLQALKDRIAKDKSNFDKDERLWEPTVDKAGNGYAVIRFLPGIEGDEDTHFVKVYSHGFKVNGTWFIENCPTTIGKKCYCCDQNSILWKTEIKSNQDIVRDRKRKVSYFSNILVIDDPSNPENNGKVFLFRYGAKIFSKIESAATDVFPGEEPFDAFNFWSGANFIIKIQNVEGWKNYDKSKFETPKPVFSDDALIEELWKKEYSLRTFVDPKQFKEYDEIKEKFIEVVGGVNKPKEPSTAERLETRIDQQESARRPAPAQSAQAPADDDIDALYADLLK